MFGASPRQNGTVGEFGGNFPANIGEGKGPGVSGWMPPFRGVFEIESVNPRD